MKRRKKTTQAEEPDQELLKHINDLGFQTVETYRSWCGENGFSKKLNKHWKQRCRERLFAQRVIVHQRLSQKKREKRSFSEVLVGICEGKLSQNDVTQPHLKRLCEAVCTKQASTPEPQVSRKSLIRLLVQLHQCRAKLFDGSPVVATLGQMPGNTFIEALALTACHAGSWLRPVEDWQPRTHSARKQFVSLLRHLFVQHDDMPLFFDAVWFSGRTKDAAERRSWYLHVGRGQNIRHCNLPVPYTKKMAHHFMKAPSDVTVDQALRWGQVLGLGGDEQLAKAIFGTRLTEGYRDDIFWTTVIRWFISNAMLDRAHVGPIIDYLHHQRFVPEIVAFVPGRRDEASPSQPNLSMKGRTPESLLRQVNQWHRKLASDNTQQMRQWQPSGIESFEFVEGSLEKPNFKCWTIRELLSSKALVAEGRQLKHCVATYASSCARGHCSIWTVEVESYEGIVKSLTVEVRSGMRLISQVRGKANRLPTDKEKNVLCRWAATAGLKLANYI